MKILLIGSGNRAKAYATYMSKEIAYVCDPNFEKAEKLISKFSLKNAKAFRDYKKCGEFDGIIIAVPDYVHEEVFDWAVVQDVPILLEKPVAVRNDSLKHMLEKGSSRDKKIILGFTLRYTFMYRKIQELLNEKAIGEIISAEANETLDPLHAAKFFRRWHRFSKYSGGLLNTKCSHDMDMLNQFIPGVPRYISSFGSNTIFKADKGKSVCDDKCPEYKTCRFIDTNIYEFSTADITLCPYQVESDIVDHQVVSMEFESGITVVFSVTMHSDKGNRHVWIHGEKGSIEAQFSDQKVCLMKTGEPDVVFLPDDTKGSHGGGDKVLCEGFIDCINGGVAENQLRDGVTASIMALAADESRKSGKVIDLTLFADYMY